MPEIIVVLHGKQTSEGGLTIACGGDCELNTPFHRADLAHDTFSVERLLLAGAGIAVLNLRGRAPLALAIMRGDAEIARLLIQYGADTTLLEA